MSAIVGFPESHGRIVVRLTISPLIQQPALPQHSVIPENSHIIMSHVAGLGARGV